MTVHRVKLSDYKDKKRDEGAIDLEMEDGTVVRVDPPELWSDEIMQTAQDGDNIGTAKLLIGADKYEAFVAAGGSSAALLGIIADTHGATVPELRASASS